MKNELLLLAISLTLFLGCKSKNPNDVSTEICNCLKEKYIGAKKENQTERLKIGESCMLENINKRAQELDKGIVENDEGIEKSKQLVEVSNQTMKSLKSNCIYFKTFTNDKLNHLKNEFKD